MNDDEIGRLLSGAFDAQARRSVGDDVAPPLPRFGQAPTRRRHRALRVLAPLAAAAAVVAVVAGVVAVQDAPKQGHAVAGPGLGTGASAASGTAPSHAAPARAVHVSLINADGSNYGVGMPVIAYFSKQITDAKAFQRATSVQVNGRSARGAWYFERSASGHGPVEAHLRLRQFWPAHAKIHVGLPVRGLPAGKGLAFQNNLTLDFSTGARNVSLVDDATHVMTVTTDGKVYGKFPVSLGSTATPTRSGTKVIMEKGASICMRGPGYSECGVRDTQRLTYDGEYLHAAPWNSYNIAHGNDTSNGCTNLLAPDAKRLYGLLEVGDVVEYPNAHGPAMQFGQGYGDWNVSWGQWLTGGLVPTS